MKILGVKKYSKRLFSKLPTLNPSGLAKDISLNLRRQQSEACHFFVMGPPRSGTTLVRGMISSHSQVTTSDRETFFFLRRRTSLFRSPDVKNYISILENSSSKVEVFDKIVNQYKSRENKNYFLKKTPEHSLLLDKLLKWYPRSKFVFLIRDGRDGYASSFSNNSFNAKVGDNYPYLWKDIARIYLAHSGDKNLFCLKYEDLVSSPKNAIQDVMAFFGLSFEEQQLDPASFSRTSMSRESGHEMLSRNVTSQSVGSYRDRLKREQIRFFESIAGEELRLLGYET